MMTILSMNKLTQDPEVLKMFARMVSSSPKERTSGIVFLNDATIF